MPNNIERKNYLNHQAVILLLATLALLLSGCEPTNDTIANCRSFDQIVYQFNQEGLRPGLRVAITAENVAYAGGIDEITRDAILEMISENGGEIDATFVGFYSSQANGRLFTLNPDGDKLICNQPIVAAMVKITNVRYPNGLETDVTIFTSPDNLKKLYLIYTIQPGDTLSDIAEEFGVPMNEILKANKDLIKDPNHIEAGWRIKIPDVNSDPSSPESSIPWHLRPENVPQREENQVLSIITSFRSRLTGFHNNHQNEQPARKPRLTGRKPPSPYTTKGII